jgi:hypothetical protein
MSDSLDKAFAAVRDWHAKVGDNLSAFKFKRGDRVLDMSGDGSLLYIASFERNGNEEYHARCLKLGTDKVELVPVNRLKLPNMQTIH